jgi:hypothetical protein
MERTPELNEYFRGLFGAFLKSTECAEANCGQARWLESFLDVFTVVDWSLDELDIYALSAALYDGMGWTIDAAPTDAEAVAREILAFLRWAARTGHATTSPDYEECCAYLGSSEAKHQIASDLRPIEISWHGSWDAHDPR